MLGLGCVLELVEVLLGWIWDEEVMVLMVG